MTLLAVVATLALVALTGSVLYAARAFSRPSPVAPPNENPSVTFENLRNLERRLDEFGEDLARLTTAVSEGIMGYKRHEKRIQKTVSAARRLVSENGLEHAGIEAEYEELQSGDGEPSGGGEVLPLREEVAPPTRTGIPGMDSEELARIRGVMNV